MHHVADPIVLQSFLDRFGEERIEERPVRFSGDVLAAAPAPKSQPCGPRHTNGCCSNRILSVSLANRLQ